MHIRYRKSGLGFVASTTWKGVEYYHYGDTLNKASQNLTAYVQSHIKQQLARRESLS